MSFGTEGESRSRARWGAAVVLGAVAATWYLWPAIGSGTSDVLVVASPRFVGLERPVAEAVRDRGRDITWITASGSWCEAASALESADLSDVDTVALAVVEIGECEGDPIRQVHDRLTAEGVNGLYVSISQHLDAPAMFESVRTVELIGTEEQLEMPCEWWNDCPPNDAVTVRLPDGTLSDEGNERVARMIAAAIG